MIELRMRMPSGREVVGYGLLGMVHVGLEQLKSYRGKAPKPDELEWEIRLYEWILKQPNPEATADAYFKARHSDACLYRSKRETVRGLGWEIP